MNSKQFQFNHCSVVSVGLAVLILILTVRPALAWEDEGGPDVHPVRSCQISAVGEGLSTVACGETTPRHPKPVISERPIAPLGVIRAEILFLRGWQPRQLAVEVNQE